MPDHFQLSKQNQPPSNRTIGQPQTAPTIAPTLADIDMALSPDATPMQRRAAVMALQRTYGNQATQRMLKPKPPLIPQTTLNGTVVLMRMGTIGPVVQREDEDEKKTRALTNDRFKSDLNLQAIFMGLTVLSKLHNGATVKAVQDALIELNCPLPVYGADGQFGSETRSAIRKFREQASLPEGDVFDMAAMEALDKAAPQKPAPPPDPGKLQNSRFAGNFHLQKVLEGKYVLSSAHNGSAVKAVQKALLDMGYPLPEHLDDGKFGDETRAAIQRFRLDQAALTPGNDLDSATMAALDKVAPAAGTTAQKSIDYGKLLADNKLTVTFAVGYDEDNNLKDDIDDGWHHGAIEAIKQFLADESFSGGEDRSGLGTYSREKEFAVPGSKDTRTIDVQVRLVTPNTQNAKSEFRKGLSQDDITVYSGHARYGTGPDFDSNKSVKENFAIGVGAALHKSGKLKDPPGENWDWYQGYHKTKKEMEKKENDLEQMQARGELDPDKYRVWFFNACSTIHYLDELRSDEITGLDRSNLDIIGTRSAIYLGAETRAAISFLKSVLAMHSMDELMAGMQGEVDAYVKEGRHMMDSSNQFFTEGFGDNPTLKLGKSKSE